MFKNAIFRPFLFLGGPVLRSMFSLLELKLESGLGFC